MGSDDVSRIIEHIIELSKGVAILGESQKNMEKNQIHLQDSIDEVREITVKQNIKIEAMGVCTELGLINEIKNITLANKVMLERYPSLTWLILQKPKVAIPTILAVVSGMIIMLSGYIDPELVKQINLAVISIFSK